MNITEELFDLRTALLQESLVEAAVPKELAEKWLKIDSAFKKGLVKKSIQECEKRFNTDEIIDVPNPKARKAA